MYTLFNKSFFIFCIIVFFIYVTNDHENLLRSSINDVTPEGGERGVEGDNTPKKNHIVMLKNGLKQTMAIERNAPCPRANELAATYPLYSTMQHSRGNYCTVLYIHPTPRLPLFLNPFRGRCAYTLPA